MNFAPYHLGSVKCVIKLKKSLGLFFINRESKVSTIWNSISTLNNERRMACLQGTPTPTVLLP